MSSNPDSFIDEVTEAVRRDRLYGYLRRYGWIGVLAVVVIVGWAAWIEWSLARHESRAEAFGDAVLAALAASDPAERQAALEKVATPTRDQEVLLALLSSTAPADADRLAAIHADPELPVVYRHLAQFRRLLLAPGMSPADRAAGFAELTAPGAPFRTLAEEQIALIEIGEGQTARAVERLTALSQDTEASGALRRRAQQLIVALGGTPAN